MPRERGWLSPTSRRNPDGRRSPRTWSLCRVTMTDVPKVVRPGIPTAQRCTAQGETSVNRCIARMLASMGVAAAATVTVWHVTVDAQDRLKSMPGYAQYERMSREIPTVVKSGALGVTWTDAKTFEYARDGKRYRYDVLTKSAAEIASSADQTTAGRGGRGGGPARGRQVDSSVS